MSTSYDYEREDAAAILATVATAGGSGGGGAHSVPPEENPPALGDFYRDYPHYEGGEQGYYGYDSRYYGYHEHQDAPPPPQGHPHAHPGGHPYDEYSTDREYAQYNPYRPRGGPPPPRAEGAAQYSAGPPPRPYYEDQYYYPERYPAREGEYHRAPPSHAPPPSYEEYPQQHPEYYRNEYRYDDPSRDRRRPPPPPQGYHYPPPHQQPHYRHDQLESPSYDSQEQFRRAPPPMRSYSEEYGHYDGRYEAEYHSQHRPPPHVPQPYHPPYGGRTYSHEEKEPAASTMPPAQAPPQHQAQGPRGSQAPPVDSQTGAAQPEEKGPKPQFHKDEPKKIPTNAATTSEVKEMPKEGITNKENSTTATTDKTPAPSPSQKTKPTTPTAATATATSSSSSTCTCKKSRCLKLYCQCFSTNSLCNPLLCRCDGCYNTAEHVNARRHAMRTILQRNPGAFRSKFVPAEGAAASAEGKEEKQDAATHKNGCKCRKSACLKKYCECFNADTKCGPNCRCLGCKNLPVGMVARGYRRDGKGGWMIDAAQNLAYLKHGSSPHHPQRPPYPPQHHLYHRSITESPPKQPMRHPPIYPPPPQQYYPYPPPLQPQQPPQQARPEQTPPRTTGSFNNDDSPSGLAVNTLLMAAYAMTELDGKKEEDGAEKAEEKKDMASDKDGLEKVDEKTDTAVDKDGAEKTEEKKDNGTGKDDKAAVKTTIAPAGGEVSAVKEGSAESPQSKLSAEASVFHSKEIGVPSLTNGTVESSQINAAPTPTKDTTESSQAEGQLKASPSHDTPPQPAKVIDTSAPPIEKLPSAEVSPDNSDEKTRKRTHTAMEEEECPSSFDPPPRPQNGKNDTKVELFRKPSGSSGIPLPERNVSADSDDVTAEKSEEVKEPPTKRAAVETS